MTPCPSRDSLAALLDGGLSAADESAVAAHLDGCPHCQTVMERLTDLGPRAVEPTAPGAADGTTGGPDARLARLRKLLPAPAAEAPVNGALPVIPGYEIVRELGRGGMAVVYEARQTRLNRRVALKLLRTGELAAPEHFVRLGSEGAIVARLQHPNIVQIYEIGLDHAQPYLALELVEGGTLEDAQAGRPVPPATAADLVKTLAAAVDYAHARGVIHRDLKPANILLSNDQCPMSNDQKQPVGHWTLDIGHWSFRRPKVADFGLAKQLDNDARLTQTGDLLGTPSYMAPEQVAGDRRQVGPWTDVYALGGILYKLLTGHPPFRGTSTLQVLEQVSYADPPPPSRLRPRTPRDLDVICLKCLEKDPARRYASAAELAADLDRFLDGRPVLARPVSVAGRAYRWARRRPAIAALLALVLVVAAAGLSGVFTQWRVAVAGEKEADRLRGVAEDERDNARRHLAQALVGEARAIRLARQPGYRDQAWDRLRRAVAVGVPEADAEAVRREATACLGDFLGYTPMTWTDLPADVTAVAVAADDTRVAIGLKDGSVLVRDGTTRHRFPPSPIPTEITSVAFAGRHLVATEALGLVRSYSWDEAGRWKALPPAGVALPGSVVRLSPDGRFIGAARGAEVTLRDRETDRVVMTGPAPGKVNSLAVARDGRWVAVGYASPGPNPRGEGTPTVQVFNGTTGEPLPTVAPGLHYVYSLTFSPDGTHLACACLEGVAVYRVPDMERVDVFRGTIAHGTAFSPDGRQLAVPTAQEDQVRLWAFGAGRDGPVLAHPGRPARAAFSPSGRTLVVASARAVRVWGLGGTPEKQVLMGHQGGVPGAAFRPDGGELASVSKDRTVRLWDPATGAARAVRPVFAGLGQAVAYTPDGRFLATGDYTAAKAQVWDLQSWQEIAAVTDGLGNRVHAVAFSQDGRYFAVGAVPGLRVFAVRTGRDVSLTPADRGPPTSGTVGHLGFGPDGKVLVWTDNSGAVRAWDLEAGRSLPAPAEKAFARIHALGFFPDGRRIIYLNRDRAAEVWDVQTGRREKVFSVAVGETEGTDSYAMHVALSPDGTMLAVSSVTGRGVNLWDVETGRLLAPLPEEPGVVWSLAWGPDGRRLAVGRSDGGLAVWDRDRVRAELESLGVGW